MLEPDEAAASRHAGRYVEKGCLTFPNNGVFGLETRIVCLVHKQCSYFLATPHMVKIMTASVIRVKNNPLNELQVLYFQNKFLYFYLTNQNKC